MGKITKKAILSEDSDLTLTAIRNRRQAARRGGLKSNGRIDWKRGSVSCRVVNALKKGFSYKAIMEATGMTAGQISYRRKIMGVSPWQWRNGETDESITILNHVFNLE